MRITKRQLLEGLGSCGALLGGAAGAAGWISPARAQPSFQGQSLTHWSFLNPEGKSLREVAIKEIDERFKRRTGIDLKVQTLPWQEMGTKLIAAVQAGSGPDSARVNIFHLKMILTAKSLTKLDPYLDATLSAEDRKDFIVDFTPATVVDGSKWTMQIEAVPKALFIRKDWLAKAGLKAPATWAELVEVAKAFTGSGRWGYMVGASKTQLNQVETIFQPHIHGRGGQIIDDSGKGAFNDEPAVKTYQFLADCVHKHKIMPPQVVSMTYDEVTDAFKAGRVGIIQEGSHRYQDIAKAIRPENLELAKVPSDDPARPSPTIVTGWGMGIPRGAKNPDASWEYIKEYISPEAQEINARVAGTLPSRKSVIDLPFFKSDEAAYMRWWLDYVAERGEVVINVATFAQLNEAMVDPLHQILVSPGTSIKPLLDAAVRRYNQAAAN